MPQRVESDRTFLSTSEACGKTGLSPTYIQRLLRDKRLDGFKAGSSWFVYEDSLTNFTAQKRKRGPKGPHKKSPQNRSNTSQDGEKANGEKQNGTET